MNIDKIERISVKMEKWHRRIFKYACIGVFIIVSDIIGLGIIGWSNFRSHVAITPDNQLPMMMYDFIVYIGSPFVYAFLCYAMIFTQFSFPVKFKGDGGGRKPRLPHLK